MISVYSDEKGKECTTGSEASSSKVPVCGGDGTWNYKRVALDVALHARCAQDVVNAFDVSVCKLLRKKEMECMSHMFKKKQTRTQM